MNEKVLRILLESLGAEIDLYTDAISGGTLKSFDEYKYQVGVLQGLRLAASHVKDLARKLHDDDFDN